MGLTYAESKLLGIGHLHPAVSRDRSAERELLDAIDPAPPTPDDGMNKLERAFSEELKCHHRLVRRWEFQLVTFRLGGSVRYTPDFDVWPNPASDWRFTLVETKGWLREDARDKLKVAAGLFPEFRWLLVYRKKAIWRIHEVDRSGIGREPIVVPWINGD
jgi:hypothetical protein